MRPDRLTVNLRPRSGFEAVDLGFALARTHARELWRAWFLLVLPVMLLFVLVGWLLQDAFPYAGWLLLWWGKPLYDTVVLLILSRAVFGERLPLRTALRELKGLSARILGALTLRRFSMSRSFLLPAHMLEGLHGTTRNRRIQLLREETTGSARMLTLAGIHMEMPVMFGLLALALFLTPELYRDPLFESLLEPETQPGMLLVWQLLYMLTLTVLEPFYMAAGFALYLNRRTLLEAWDIEVALKRITARVGSGRTGAAT